MDEAARLERRTLAAEGIGAVLETISPDTGKLLEAPEFLSRGLVHDDAGFVDLVPRIESVLAKAASAGIKDTGLLEKRIERELQNLMIRKQCSSPVIVPIVWEG